jgi:hypothetical protein
MKNYTLEGKVDSAVYDDILFDIDHGVEVEITCGPGISLEDANKIAALGQPVNVKAYHGDAIADTVANLVSNSPECVIVDLTISSIGLSIGNTRQFLNDYMSDPRFAGSKLRLVNSNSTPNAPVPSSTWNNIIVTCLDHGVVLCWNGHAASDRYTEYLKSIA